MESKFSFEPISSGIENGKEFFMVLCEYIETKSGSTELEWKRLDKINEYKPSKFATKATLNPLLWNKLEKSSENAVSPKRYRSDLNLYEEKIMLFKLIPFYRYSIWRKGKVRSFISLFQKKRKSINYFDYPTFVNYNIV